MKKLNTHTTKIRLAILLIAGLALLPAIVLAHGGLEHVIGTVVKISDSAISVKTLAGKIVEVAFDEKTTYTRAKIGIDKRSIKEGDRVVIHAAEIKEKLVARTVEIGTAGVAQKAAQ